MIDGFRTEMDVHVDTMAERVVQLGGIALGTTQTVAQGSRLKAYPLDLVSVKDHITALEEAMAFSPVRSEAGDADTADIFTAFSRSLDKALWFLEAHEADKA